MYSHAACVLKRNNGLAPGELRGIRAVIFLLAIAFLTGLGAGCSLFGVNGSDARIVLGKSIEGVEIGNSEEEVIEQLGEPDQTQPADLAGERFLYFNDDQNLTLEVTISKDQHIGLGVIAVSAYPPYDGKTEQGLGTGSTRSEVTEIVGEPDRRDGAFETYSFDGTRFVFEYREDTVHTIRMSG